KIGTRNGSHRLRVAVPRSGHVVELTDEIQNIRQLHGALHTGVARQDLLDERRPRSRQSNDEDRCGTRIPTTRTRGKERGVEERSDARSSALEAFDVERSIQTPQLITPGIVRKRLSVLLTLLKRLSQREIQLCFVGTRTLVSREQPLHCSNLLIAESI